MDRESGLGVWGGTTRQGAGGEGGREASPHAPLSPHDVELCGALPSCPSSQPMRGPRLGGRRRSGTGPDPGAESERRGGGGRGGPEGAQGREAGGGDREEEEAAGGGRPRGVADVALSPDPPSRFGPRAAAERRGRSWELEGARKAPPKGSATPGPELAACRPLSRGPPRIPAAGRLVGSPPGLAERRSRPRKVVGPVIELSNGCSCRPKMAGQGGERGGGVGWGGDKHETNTAKRRARRAERAARPSAEGKELRARCPGAARGRAGPYQPVARAAPRSAPR